MPQLCSIYTLPTHPPPSHPPQKKLFLTSTLGIRKLQDYQNVWPADFKNNLYLAQILFHSLSVPLIKTKGKVDFHVLSVACEDGQWAFVA